MRLTEMVVIPARIIPIQAQSQLWEEINNTVNSIYRGLGIFDVKD